MIDLVSVCLVLMAFPAHTNVLMFFPSFPGRLIECHHDCHRGSSANIFPATGLPPREEPRRKQAQEESKEKEEERSGSG